MWNSFELMAELLSLNKTCFIFDSLMERKLWYEITNKFQEYTDLSDYTFLKRLAQKAPSE